MANQIPPGEILSKPRKQPDPCPRCRQQIRPASSLPHAPAAKCDWKRLTKSETDRSERTTAALAAE